MSYSTQRVLPGIGSQSAFWQRFSVGQFMMFLVALVGAGVFYIWSCSTLIELGYAISSCESQLLDLQREENCLRLEVATLKNPAHLERVASTRLNLHYPEPHQVIIVR
jgi:cell division protein FtsL